MKYFSKTLMPPQPNIHVRMVIGGDPISIIGCDTISIIGGNPISIIGSDTISIIGGNPISIIGSDTISA
jgi:hypothetical protein